MSHDFTADEDATLSALERQYRANRLLVAALGGVSVAVLMLVGAALSRGRVSSAPAPRPQPQSRTVVSTASLTTSTPVGFDAEELRRKLLGLQPDPVPTPQVSAEIALAHEIMSESSKPLQPIDLHTPARFVAPDLATTLPEHVAFAVIDDNLSAIRNCLEQAKSVAKASMDLSLTIAPSGQVSRVALFPSKHAASDVGQCVMKRAQSWRFPKFSGREVTVRYPLLLSGT